MRARAHVLRTLPLLPLVVLLTALPLLWPGVARAQVSPGPLAAAHAALDGPVQCFQCHARGASKDGMDQRCLACHTEVGWMRERKRGFHAGVAAKACASCHPDHGGRDFALVAWDGGAPEKFEHRRAGFSLVGKHASLACRSCHQPSLQKSGATALLRRKNHAQSWLGLETACADCHGDPHRGQLGAQCARCHGQAAWKPVPLFDHAKTAYPLTGRHVGVECAKCHATATVATARDPQGKPLPQWQPLPHADCASCHSDPHAGRFPGACARCHTTDDFHRVRAGGFDHELTRYPLRGLHASVACAKCHDERTGFSAKPKFALCTDCHRDAHHGQGTLAGKPADCAACHDVRGFAHATYTVAQHQASAFPLAGRHASVACASCHARRLADVALLGTSGVVMRPPHAACEGCHADPHRGRFAPGGPRAHERGCVACHGLEHFRPSTFDVSAHAFAAFPLAGAHRALPCQQCHAELAAPASHSSLLADAATLAPLTFENPARACVDCHADSHHGQFAARRDKGACEGCHGLDAFAPASRFAHDRDTKFKLEGAHAKAACAACHVPQPGPDGKPFVRYAAAPSRCEDCHARTN